MIKLFYSGGKTPNQPQPRPEKSLGGFLSTTPVNNGRANNLFEDASVVSSHENKSQVIGLFIVNESEAPVYQVYVGYVLPLLATSQIRLSVVGVDQIKPALEVLSSNEDLPMIGDFYDLRITDPDLAPNENGSGFTVPVLAAGASLGLWVKRTTLMSAMALTREKLAVMLAEFKAADYANINAPNESENLQIVITYNDSE